MRTMSFEMGTDPGFWGFGAKDVYDRKKRETGCGPVSLFKVSLCNNFADRKRSNVSYNCNLPNWVASPLLPDP